MSARIRVLIADDHPLLRDGVRRILQDEEDIEVVGEASDGEETVARALELSPDVVLMDISMPGIGGLEATRQVRARNPSVQVLGLTVHENSAYFFSMLEAGAAGYLLKKDATSAELLEAVRAVHREGVYLHPTVARWLIRDRMSRGGEERESPLPSLTPRETEVLKLLAEGCSTREIAHQLHLSPTTVQTHRTNIMQKLNLHSRVELVKYALSRGLISLSSS